MSEEYKTLLIAFKRAITDIWKNDLEIKYVEVHGPHSGYKIEFQGNGNPWISTPIEK